MLTDPVSVRRRNRRTLVAAIGVGVGGGLLLREVAGYPLAGELVYWLGIVAAIAVWVRSPVPLLDERDRALERRASQATISVTAVAVVLAASAARVLSVTDTVAVPDTVWTVLWAYVGLFVVWVGSYAWLRYRP